MSSSSFSSSVIGLSGSCIRLNFNPPSVFFLLNGDWISGWISLLIPLIPISAAGAGTGTGVGADLISVVYSFTTTKPDDSPTCANSSYLAGTGSGTTSFSSIIWRSGSDSSESFNCLAGASSVLFSSAGS